MHTLETVLQMQRRNECPNFVPLILMVMKISKAVRDLIIGRDQFIESHGEFKQVMLSGQYALMCILMCLLYAAVDFFEKDYTTFRFILPHL